MIINRLGRISNSIWFLWLVLAVPLLYLTTQYLAGKIYYGEYVHATGVYAARFLILTMAITPFRLLWPKANWTRWLLQRRRYFGVAVFAYAVPHCWAYVVKIGTFAGVLNEAAEPGLWTGWVAFILFLPLALTSNNASMRKLGAKWKKLHRFVYLAAILTFIHWLLVAFNPMAGLIHAGVLLLLETYRIYATTRAKDNNKV